jgi:hypothetical protein
MLVIFLTVMVSFVLLMHLSWQGIFKLYQPEGQECTVVDHGGKTVLTKRVKYKRFQQKIHFLLLTKFPAHKVYSVFSHIYIF